MVLSNMPPKIKDLIKILEKSGFINRGGKGSHRNFKHPKGLKLTLSGKASQDAKIYQERLVEKMLKKLKK